MSAGDQACHHGCFGAVGVQKRWADLAYNGTQFAPALNILHGIY
jgi:hypothetical protein